LWSSRVECTSNNNGKVSKGVGASQLLSDISADAESSLLDCLAGPPEFQPNCTSMDQRSAEVRRSIGRGCINLKIDYWGASNSLSSSSSSVAALKEHQTVDVRWMLALHERVPDSSYVFSD
jgi:hypothetical protein